MVELATIMVCLLWRMTHTVSCGFEGEHLPTLVDLDDELRDPDHVSYRGNVIYTSTYSKISGAWAAYWLVIAPEEVIRKNGNGKTRRGLAVLHL